MAKQRYKRIQGGRLVREVLWTPTFPSDTPKQREAKTKISSAARKKINQRCAWQKLMMQLAANFSPADLHVVLTYDDEHLPETAAEARKCMKKFLTALRKSRKSKGEELLYIYNMENRHGNKRIHHHLVINGTGEDYELIRALWPYGTDLSFERIDAYGYTGLAQYLTKEAREDGLPVGARSWVPSLNLKKPEIAPTEWVPDSMRLDPPPNAYILERESQTNEFGRFEYIEYLLPELPLHQKTRPRRKAKSNKAL